MRVPSCPPCLRLERLLPVSQRARLRVLRLSCITHSYDLNATIPARSQPASTSQTSWGSERVRFAAGLTPGVRCRDLTSAPGTNLMESWPQPETTATRMPRGESGWLTLSSRFCRWPGAKQYFGRSRMTNPSRRDIIGRSDQFQMLGGDSAGIDLAPAEGALPNGAERSLASVNQPSRTGRSLCSGLCPPRSMRKRQMIHA